MNILELTADEVKRFFLEHENYFSLKLPDYISYANIYNYFFKIRLQGGSSIYVSFDGSTNRNTVDYTLFNGIKFQLDLNSNILKLVANPNYELISIDVFNNLTQL